MSLINKKNNRGDTLIEVLFATAVFSLVAVGSLSIMNQGAATAQRALEITLVRQEMDAQAETLRYLNKIYVSNYPNTDSPTQWAAISGYSVTKASDFPSCDEIPSGAFILNAKKAEFIKPEEGNKPGPAITFSRVEYDNDIFKAAQGIWIEAEKHEQVGDQSNAIYTDFHIRACWDSPGQSVPVTLGTIVRLYEPK